MKTATQELIDYVKKVWGWDEDFEVKAKQLLEKEKEQIAKAFDDRAKPYPYVGDENWEVLDCTGEFYYNYTYNQNNNNERTTTDNDRVY